MAATAPLPPVSSPRHRVKTVKPNRLLDGTTTVAKEILAQIGRARTTGLAAELAFWLFLSILPIAAVASLFAARFASSNQNVATMMFDATPPAMRQLLSSELASISAWNGGKVGFVAAATFVWLASSGVASIFDAIELEVGVERAWWKKRLIAVGCCFVLSVGIVIVGFLFTGVSAIARLTGHVIVLPALLSGAGAGIARVGASALIGFLMLAGLYLAGVPHAARHRMAVVPGALIAVLLEGILGLGYSLYIKETGTGDAYQGTLAVIGITLMSLYLVSLAILIGVEASLYIGQHRFAKKQQRFQEAHKRIEQRDPSLLARHTEEETIYDENGVAP